MTREAAIKRWEEIIPAVFKAKDHSVSPAILDNCMGSGTTAVACIKEKRHFIGFELNELYWKKACQRIDAEQRQLSLF